MKFFLLIQSYNDFSSTDDNRICRFLVFGQDNPEYKSLLRYYGKCIYELNEKQYDSIKNYNQTDFSKLTKKDFLIKNNLEEFLI